MFHRLEKVKVQHKAIISWFSQERRIINALEFFPQISVINIGQVIFPHFPFSYSLSLSEYVALDSGKSVGYVEEKNNIISPEGTIHV